MVGDDCGRDLIHLQATVSFGNLYPAQTQFASFLEQIARNGEVLVLHLFDVGNYFVLRELLGSLTDQIVLFGEIFRCENLGGGTGFKQEAAAGDGTCNSRGR